MKLNNNNYILGIETTGKISGVALCNNNKIVDECNIDTGLTHSVTLFNNVNSILVKSKISIKDISEIKVSAGPGSFTGIRIGIACAIGLSEPYNTKITYVDTLRALAYNVIGKENYIFSMIDAKADRIYLAIFESKTLKQISNDLIININDLSIMINKYFTNKNLKFIFVGDGAINYKSFFKKQLINIKYSIANNSLSTLKASSVALIDGKSDDYPKINYILASKAEREYNGKSKFCK